MEQLKFSYNWNNKLNCHYYTTIRLSSPKYHKEQIIDVQLKGQHLHQGKIIEIRVIGIDQINEFIGGLDTGYGAEETKNILKKMYKQATDSTTLFALMLIRNEDWWQAHLRKMEKVVNENNQNIKHPIELE